MSVLEIARIGTSPAGKRIHDAGVAYQRAQQPPVARVERLEPVEPPPVEPPGNCHEIIRQVCKKHSTRERPIRFADIVGPFRWHYLIVPRHEAIYRCAAETDKLLTWIGRLFNRHHTTIMYAVRAHADRTGEPSVRGSDRWRPWPRRSP